MRLIDADAFKKQIQENVSTFYTCGSGGYYLAEDVIEDIDNAPTVDIKTEVAREIFAEIEEEIQSALRNNYNVRSKRIEKHGTSDGFISVVDGKILALRGIDDFIAELKNKYTKELKEGVK